MRSATAPNLILPNGFEANFTLGFIKGLVANKVTVLVLSCDDTEGKLKAAGIPSINVRGSLDENRAVGEKVRNLLRYYARTMLLLYRYRGGTVHFTGILDARRILLEGLLLHLWARLTAARYIYTVHNVLPHGRDQSRFFRRFYRVAYRVPHLLVVHVPSARDQLIKEFRIPADRILLSSIGLNEEMPITSLTRAEARRKLGLGENEKVILSFGRIDEYKGLDLLIAAFDELTLAEMRLVVAGPFGDSNYRRRILDAMSRARRTVQISLHEGFVPNEEGEVFFKAADVLCLPYRNIYQSGLVFLAPRFGLPIVSTNVGSMSEFIAEDTGVIAQTNDVAGIRDALRLFFERIDRFQRDRIAAHAQKYRWSEICRQLVPFYVVQPDRAVA